MGKKTLDQLTLIDLSKGKKQPFARKVAVIAFYLKKKKPNIVIPHFLFTVIVPKQPAKVTDKWNKAKSYKLPGGFSLIKGSREMMRAGIREDIPPGFGGYFRKKVSGNLKKKEIDKKINGLIPAPLSVLLEAKEEGGIKTNNIKLIFDLGIQILMMGKRKLKVDTFAIELKKPGNGKAIDSLEIDYFTLGELQLASKLRTRFNIPLVRPLHVHFVEDMIPELAYQYSLENKIFSEKAATGKKARKKNEKRRNNFIQLVKKARQGKFLAWKYSEKQTRNNIIEKSIESRERQQKKPKGKY